jgi:hypothetical protein
VDGTISEARLVRFTTHVVKKVAGDIGASGFDLIASSPGHLNDFSVSGSGVQPAGANCRQRTYERAGGIVIGHERGPAERNHNPKIAVVCVS